MNAKAQPVFETRIPDADGLKRKQVGASEFRIHTWFDHDRNTFVIDVLSANEPVPEVAAGRAAAR
ncbi:MAG TPA: hypothetical protein VE998_04725 [Terriglobales bacterium]|nr:hypothetical protein [Terriglobales bacterium]